jgi:hypothetical protein
MGCCFGVGGRCVGGGMVVVCGGGRARHTVPNTTNCKSLRQEKYSKSWGVWDLVAGTFSLEKTIVP